MAFLDIDWRDDGTDVRSGLWRLNIAAEEQGRGYGRFAVTEVAEELRRRGTKTLHVTWHPGEHGRRTSTSPWASRRRPRRSTTST
jgi:diamine N-acetyltransferase